jgi:hypothetical protein
VVLKTGTETVVINLSSASLVCSKQFRLVGLVNGCKANIFVDQGSDGMIVSRKWLKHNKMKATAAGATQYQIEGFNGSTTLSQGVLEHAHVEYMGYKDHLDFVVADCEVADIVLGLPWCNAREPVFRWKDRVIKVRMN